MRKCRLRLVGAACALLLLAAAAALFAAAQATARTRTYDDREEGEVVVNGAVVMRIRTAAGGYSATQRAEQVADRLNKAFAAGITWKDFRVGEMNRETAVLDSRGELIVTADRFHAQANGTTPFLLARAWDTNLVQALGGEVPNDQPASAAEPAPASSEVSWDLQDNKVVPIFSIGTPGISIGAARVSGPKVEVGKVKAVAQIEAEFKNVLRAHVFIPVSSISTKPERVQGVSVSALIDYNMPF
jgi:hypothetical protein